MSLGHISISYVDILCKTMNSLGLDEHRMLALFSLNQQSLRSPNARISIAKYMRMGEMCIRQANMPWLGLVMGKNTALTHLGLAGLTALAAKDLGTSCQCLTEYEQLNSYNVRGKSRFSMEEQRGVLSFYSIQPYNQFNYFIVDLVLSGWSNAVAVLTGKNDLVARVCFEFPEPAYVEHYQTFFNCEVLFSQPYNRLELKQGAVDAIGENRCGATFNMLERIAKTELEVVQSGMKFDQVVSRAITPLLNGSTPSLEQVAVQLNMAPWTVRRRLGDESVTFQQVLNNTRCDMAKTYVKDTQHSLGEIAYLLGFGSATAFQRAFKRWTDVAPGAYRLQQ